MLAATLGGAESQGSQACPSRTKMRRFAGLRRAEHWPSGSASRLAGASGAPAIQRRAPALARGVRFRAQAAARLRAALQRLARRTAAPAGRMTAPEARLAALAAAARLAGARQPRKRARPRAAAAAAAAA